MLSELEAKAEQHHQNRNEESTHHWWSESAEVKLMLVGPQSPKQNCWLVGWMDGWMDGWTTHSSSRGPQAQPPPADLRVSSGNVIAALPASFWWPSRAETGTREEGLKTKEGPEQSQERATSELKSPTVTGHQPLAKHEPSKATPKTPTDRNPLGGSIKPTRESTIGTMHRNHGQHHATRQGEIRSLPSANFFKMTGHFPR